MLILCLLHAHVVIFSTIARWASDTKGHSPKIIRKIAWFGNVTSGDDMNLFLGELYSEAAEAAMVAMKGKLSAKYYMLAEEAWAQVEE